MAKSIYTCCGMGTPRAVLTANDAQLVNTARGFIPASSVVPNTPSSLTVNGADPNGHVSYTAHHGGEKGNEITVSHDAGDLGAGNEDRALEVQVGDKQITVVFGTGPDGGSVVPTSQQVADAVNAANQTVVDAAASGDGSGLVSQAAHTLLTGGANDGTWLKFISKAPQCLQVSRIESN